MNYPEEKLTLQLSMPPEPWSHWKCGLGRTPVGAVVREGIDKVRTNPKARAGVKHRCKQVRESWAGSSEDPSEEPGLTVIEIQVPGADWIEAGQLIGEVDTATYDGPVSDHELLAAVILESESWKQAGKDEFRAGWCENQLISSASTGGLRFHLGERGMIVAGVATVVIAAATATQAIASFWGLYCKCG